MPIKAPRDIVEAIRRFDAPIQALALALRPIIHEELTPCYEHIYEMTAGASLVYSTTGKPIGDGICYIGLNAKHVTFGFMHGAEFNDPKQMLRGAGKVMRHVQIREAEDVAQPELRLFLRQARQLAGMPKRKPGAPIRITRVMNRRPRSAPQAPRSSWPAKFF